MFRTFIQFLNLKVTSCLKVHNNVRLRSIDDIHRGILDLHTYHFDFNNYDENNDTTILMIKRI